LKLGLNVSAAFAAVGFMLILGGAVALAVGLEVTDTFAGGVALADGFMVIAAVDIIVGTALQKCTMHTSMRICRMNILNISDCL
jgi:hypothetical protein